MHDLSVIRSQRHNSCRFGRACFLLSALNRTHAGLLQMNEIIAFFSDYIPYLIICPLAAVAGFVDAVAGGGGLISLPAFFIAGVPPHLALGTNKLMSTLGTSISTWRYIKAGYVRWLPAVCCIPCAFAGSALGAQLVLHVSAVYLKIMLLFLLPATAIFLMRKRSFSGSSSNFSVRKVIVAGMISALVIGIYDGFYGPGTGVFLILSLTFIAHMQLAQANGLTKIINLSTNAAALTVFISSGSVLFSLGLTAAVFNIIGNYVGSGFFKSKGQNGCRFVMLAVICIFFIKVMYEIVGEF